MYLWLLSVVTHQADAKILFIYKVCEEISVFCANKAYIFTTISCNPLILCNQKVTAALGQFTIIQ